MAKVSYKILERRQKTQIKIYLVLVLALALSVGLYGYKNWQEYSVLNKASASSRNLISELRDEASDEKVEYEGQKQEFDGLRKEIEDSLSSIFPSNDDYTNLTRQIDEFEQEISTKNNPFNVSNIDFQGVVEMENYFILPVRMNIRSSDDNFTKFLHFIESSGAIDSDVRLMDISSIKINFEKSAEEVSSEVLNFSVQINAYFQKNTIDA